ncbi:MAG: class I SAM-dependent methyltransferase [Rhodospirillaceae bacterium]
MTGWTGGYVSDIEYAAGFYGQQAPSFLQLACLLYGVEPPAPRADFDYLELGCGQGFTATLLAAANPDGRFVATDFNPAHIARARDFAARVGLPNLTAREASFDELAAEFAGRPPGFDFITLHGVYSWVSPENRRAIVELIRHGLRPGGVVYVTYNAMPGWTPLLPLQRWLNELSALSPERSDRRVVQALDFARRMTAAGAVLLNPGEALDHLNGLAARGETPYLAHEYLNPAWTPLFHSEVARAMAGAKLDFVGSANLLDAFPDLSFSPEQRALLAELPDGDVRETAKDMFINRRFRADIYVRGLRRLSPSERESRLRRTRLSLIVPRERAETTLNVPLGCAELDPTTYGPIFDALATEPRMIGDLLALPGVAGRSKTNAVEIAGMLTGSDQARPMLDAVHDTGPAERFNRALATDALSAPLNRRLALAVPVLGTGLDADTIELAVHGALLASPAPDLDALARALWASIAARGETLIADGEPVEGDEENLRVMRERVRAAVVRMKKVHLTIDYRNT